MILSLTVDRIEYTNNLYCLTKQSRPITSDRKQACVAHNNGFWKSKTGTLQLFSFWWRPRVVSDAKKRVNVNDPHGRGWGGWSWEWQGLFLLCQLTLPEKARILWEPHQFIFWVMIFHVLKIPLPQHHHTWDQNSIKWFAEGHIQTVFKPQEWRHVVLLFLLSSPWNSSVATPAH